MRRRPRPVQSVRGHIHCRPLPARTAERRHADIWHALVKELDALDVKHANSRFGRYGPDLLAQSSGAPLLFEIKADATASDIQRALGQLQLYEHLGGQPCRKIMVLPEAPGRPIAKALAALDIEMLLFTRRGTAVRFDRPAVRKLVDLAAKKPGGGRRSAHRKD